MPPCLAAYVSLLVQCDNIARASQQPTPADSTATPLALPCAACFRCLHSAAAADASLPSSLRATFSAVSGDTAEQLSDCLLGLGAQSVVVQESRQEGQPEQEKFGAEAGLWDSCEVLAHFPLEVGCNVQ
jgi:hypothetical protein